MLRQLLLMLVAVLLATRTAGAQTPATKVLNDWLTTFNSGNSSRLLTFWKTHGSAPPEAQASRDLKLYDMTGGFTIVKILEDTGTHLAVSMKDGRGGYAEISLDLTSSKPPLIKSIVGRPVPPPMTERSPVTSDEELLTQVTDRVSELLKKDDFSGAILIARQGRPILARAWGFADREKKIGNTVDTQFCLGSMNKMFTAVAVLQLVQEGKLSLDSALAEYWPDYPNHDLATRVKIRQLLTHTGGTGDIFTPEYEAHRSETRTLADYVELFGKRPLAFEPGSKFAYSNYGYILLGRLVEIVSGEDYASYVRKHIYAPAGMTHTDSRASAESGRATGYTKIGGALRSNSATLPLSSSAGGGYSTVGDLFLFAKALQAGKLLEPSLLKAATSDQSHHGYGFGFNIAPDGTFGHGGGAPGINGEMRILPSGYIVIVLANLDPPSATAMANFVEARAPSQTI